MTHRFRGRVPYSQLFHITSPMKDVEALPERRLKNVRERTQNPRKPFVGQ